MATLTQQRSQQRPFTWHTVWLVLVVLFWMAIVVGIIGGYMFDWKWTGFGTKANGTLWDWLQLLVAPVFVSLIPLIFKEIQKINHSADNSETAHTQNGLSAAENHSDAISADDHQQEAVLETYLNHMAELLLEKNLKGSQSGSDIREVARAWTLTVLRRLDRTRKSVVLQFLHEAGLIYSGKTIIDLRQADLRGADLRNARLNGTNLSGVDFSNADLSGADFSNANLEGATLHGATYTREQLGTVISLKNIIP